MYVQRMLKA